MSEIGKIPNSPDALCGGQKPFAQCETVQSMLSESDDANPGLEGDTGSIWTTLAYLSRTCLNCDMFCAVELESIGKQRTGEIRFKFEQP